MRILYIQILYIKYSLFSEVLFCLDSGHSNSFEMVSHIFMCISWIISDIEHLLLQAICMSSLEKYLFKSLAYF